MPAAVTDRIVVCGVSGSGKTTLLRTWYLDRARTALILDQTGEWEDRPEARLTFEAAETLEDRKSVV